MNKENYCFWFGIFNIINTFFSAKSIFWLNAIHNKIPVEFFFGGGTEIDKIVIKFLLKGTGLEYSKIRQRRTKWEVSLYSILRLTM